MRKFLYYFFIIVFFSANAISVLAQTHPVLRRICGSEFPLQEILSDPQKAKIYRVNEKRLQDKISMMNRGLSVDMNKTYYIPVVFHIVDPNPNSITDAMVQQQIAVLNRDYSGVNADSVNATGFYNIRGHVKLVFVLAKRSPDGCDTNGITRKVSNLTFSSAAYGLVKHSSSGGTDAWDSYNCKYLNIWVGNFTGGILGKGTFPYMPGLPENEQGVVIQSTSFSFSVGQYRTGRTLTHEVGHFFNLRHIWGDAAGCATDDGINDTPLQDVETYGYPKVPKFDVCSPAATVKGINFQNYMDYSDDSCLTMFTKQQDSLIVATITTFSNRTFLVDANNKALKPMEPNIVFNTCTNPVFATNSFTTIGVGINGAVWAGTSNLGLYKYNNGDWAKWNLYSNNLYQDIKTDKGGGIWIAQSGYSGAQANTGGILYFPDTTFPVTANFYSASSGLPSRYVRSLFIDTTRYNVPSLTPVIWSANFANITAGVSSNGGIGRGFNPVAPNFSKILTGLDPTSVTGGTAACNILGGNSTEIWTFVSNNYGRSQILVHDAITNAFIQAYDTTNFLDGLVSPQFNAKAIYFDAKGNRWIGVNASGIIVMDSVQVWSKIAFPALFPSTPTFNNNAIAGDSSGNVYIGTANGLIVYRAGYPIDKDSSYKLYTTANGLPSNNIKAIAVDTLRKQLLIATDNGIVFWNAVCAGAGPGSSTFTTTAAGDWNNPASWCGGTIPPFNANVIVKHAINITVNSSCKSLKVIAPATVNVSPGIILNISTP